ncbi:uncharacterized protein LOC143628853 [Bidens hawaiensis]|uniref:uncharacterized protein LOC143628853 n=1 Tax=Bidens hawaiensis TaxID=980011 RepID=UPI00404A00B6
MEYIVIISKCNERESIQYSSQMFKGEALEWWNTLVDVKGRSNLYNLELKTFKELIKQRFCPIHEIDQIQTKLWNHKVVAINIKEYNTKFLVYCRLVPHLVTPEYNKVTRYIYGLPNEIRDHVRSHMPATIASAIELAGYLMESHKEEDCRKKLIVCFDCGERGHFSAECTKKKPVVGGASDSVARNDGKKGNARAFMLNT